MSYNAIPTYVTYQIITAAHGNTYWKDNFAALWPFQAIGDIAYAGAVDSLSRLAIGSSPGQALLVNSSGNAPIWGSIFTCFDSLTHLTNENTNSTSWGDVPNVTKDISVPVDCSLLALLQMRLSSQGTGSASAWRLNIDGTPGVDIGKSKVSSYYVPGFLMQLQAVSAGTITVKLQADNDAGCTAYSQDHRLLIFGMVLP